MLTKGDLAFGLAMVVLVFGYALTSARDIILCLKSTFSSVEDISPTSWEKGHEQASEGSEEQTADPGHAPFG